MFVLDDILAQCMASIVVGWSVGCTYPASFHMDVNASPCELKMMYRVCGKLCLLSGRGQVGGNVI